MATAATGWATSSGDVSPAADQSPPSPYYASRDGVASPSPDAADSSPEDANLAGPLMLVLATVCIVVVCGFWIPLIFFFAAANVLDSCEVDLATFLRVYSIVVLVFVPVVQSTIVFGKAFSYSFYNMGAMVYFLWPIFGTLCLIPGWVLFALTTEENCYDGNADHRYANINPRQLLLVALSIGTASTLLAVFCIVGIVVGLFDFTRQDSDADDLVKDSPPATTAATMTMVGADSTHAAVELVHGPLLHLGVILFFAGRWIDAHLALTLVLLALKGFWFRYPAGWQLVEALLAATGLALARPQRFMGFYGNRAQNASSLGAFLALTAPLMILVGYFAGMQVYVTNLELALGSISVALLFLLMVFGAAAGCRCVRWHRDRVSVAAGVFVGMASLALATWFLLAQGASYADFLVAQYLSISLIAISCVLAIVFSVFAIDMG